MALTISRSLLIEIKRAAAADRDEICGLLFGDEARIEAWRQAANVAADRARRFEIDPAALFAALRAERAGGARVIGYVHSHPSGAAAPSTADAEAAAPDGRMWMIVAGEEVTLWRAVAADGARTSFQAVAMRVAGA